MQYPTFNHPGTEAQKSETFVMIQNRLMKEEADAVAKSKNAPNEEKREDEQWPVVAPSASSGSLCAVSWGFWCGGVVSEAPPP